MKDISYCEETEKRSLFSLLVIKIWGSIGKETVNKSQIKIPNSPFACYMLVLSFIHNTVVLAFFVVAVASSSGALS